MQQIKQRGGEVMSMVQQQYNMEQLRQRSDRVFTCALSATALALALALPADVADAQPAPAGRFFEHNAASGDTLIALANRYLKEPLKWQPLQKLNNIADPRRIKPGSKIRIPIELMRTEPMPVRVVAVEGPVESGANKLAVGATVSEGANIRTGENGFVTLQLADGSTIAVQSKSQVKLDNARVISNTGGVQATRVSVQSGRVESNIRKPAAGGATSSYEVATPTSNMGVRGTRFRVSTDEGGKASRSEVLEGLVGVAGLSAVSPELGLNAGFGTVVEEGKAASAPVKLLPAPDLRAAPTLQERTLTRFKFDALPEASGYRGQVATDDKFVNLVADDVFKTPEAKFANLADGSYFLRVRGIDKQALEGTDATVPFKLKARPEPPFASFPANKGKLAAPTVEFKWSQSTDAGSYRFQLASAPDFSKIVADERGVKGAAITPAPALVPGEYFWRVSSVRPDGDVGPFGDTQSFTLKPMPAAPSPPKEDGNRVTFAWGGEPGQTFDFQLARDAAFSNIVTQSKLDKPEIVVEKPKEAGTYFMRYRATDPDGFVGPYSSAQTIDVKASPQPWWLLLLAVPFLL
jgi:hypothetical protein